MTCSFNLYSQTFQFDKSKLEAVNSSMSIEMFMGKKSIKVIKDSTEMDLMNPLSLKKRYRIQKWQSRSKSIEQASTKCT